MIVVVHDGFLESILLYLVRFILLKLVHELMALVVHGRLDVVQEVSEFQLFHAIIFTTVETRLAPDFFVQAVGLDVLAVRQAVLEVAHATVAIESINTARETVRYAIQEVTLGHAEYPVVLVRAIHGGISLRRCRYLLTVSILLIMAVGARETPEFNHAYDTRDAVGDLAVLDELVPVRRNHLIRPVVHVQLAEVVESLESLRLLLVRDGVRQNPDVVEVRLTSLSLHVGQYVVTSILRSVRFECENALAERIELVQDGQRHLFRERHGHIVRLDVLFAEYVLHVVDVAQRRLHLLLVFVQVRVLLHCFQHFE